MNGSHSALQHWWKKYTSIKRPLDEFRQALQKAEHVDKDTKKFYLEMDDAALVSHLVHCVNTGLQVVQ